MWLQNASKAQLLDALFSKINPFQRPMSLLAGNGFTLAAHFLRDAYRFGSHQAGDHAPHIEHISDRTAIIGRAQALVIERLKDIFNDLGIAVGAGLQRSRVITLSSSLYTLDIGFRASPPEAVDLITRIAYRLGLLEHGRIHDPVTHIQHIVRAVTAHLQPGRLLVGTRRGYWLLVKLKTKVLGMGLEHRHKLMPEGGIHKDIVDGFAPEVFQAAFTIANGLDHDISGNKVIRNNGENPFKNLTIGSSRRTITGNDDGYLIFGRFFKQSIGDSGRQRLHYSHAAVLTFHALITLDTLGGVIGKLALFNPEFDAVNTALGINQLQVVDGSIGYRYTIGRIGPGPIGKNWGVLLGTLC